MNGVGIKKKQQSLYEEHLQELGRVSKYFNSQTVHPLCKRLNCKAINRCPFDAVSTCGFFLDELKYVISLEYKISLRGVVCSTCGQDVTMYGHGRASCREFGRNRAI